MVRSSVWVQFKALKFSRVMISLSVLFQVIQFSSSISFHLLCCDDLFVLGELQVLTKDEPKFTSD